MLNIQEDKGKKREIGEIEDVLALGVKLYVWDYLFKNICLL